MSRSIGQWYNFVIKQPGVRLFKARNKRLEDGRRRLILGTPADGSLENPVEPAEGKEGTRVLRVGAWSLLCRDQRQANTGKESNRSKERTMVIEWKSIFVPRVGWNHAKVYTDDR